MSDQAWHASPILGVRHVRRTAEYYRDVLGFDLDPADGVFQPTPDDPEGVYGIVKRFGASIHFQIRRGALDKGQRPALERDIYIYVDDVDALNRDLQSRGATIVKEPHLAPYGIRELVIEDLNGYRIAFGERQPSRMEDLAKNEKS